MKLHEVMPLEKQKALRAMALQVEEDRREKEMDTRLAKQLGIEPGDMTHGELLTLLTLREGQTGQRVSRGIARSKSRNKGFSPRIAAANTAPR